MFSQFLGGSNMPLLVGGMVALFPLLMAWSLVWKGWSLWIAARAGSKPWFIVLLIFNTLGILDILYIFVFSKQSGAVNSNGTANKLPDNEPKI